MLGLALAATIVWAGSQSASAVPVPLPAASAEPIVAPSVSPALPESVRHWSPEIERWAAEFELPVELVAVVMTIESCGNPAARSGAGAQGLFQVMPFHFAPGEDASDPEVNAQRGLAYLRRSLQLASGDTALALAGYNGGHSLIQRDPYTWPAETSRYVRWGSGILADLGAGMSSSPALQSWLDAGGTGLCRRADERVF
jgi:soluble lytic murein transglycosylase-like protein